MILDAEREETLESYLKIKKVDYNNLMDFRDQLGICNQDFFVTGEYVHELPSSEVLVILRRKYENPSCYGQSNCLSRFFSISQCLKYPLH